MTISDTELSVLLDHESAADQTRWPDFLLKLANAMKSTATVLMRVSAGEPCPASTGHCRSRCRWKRAWKCGRQSSRSRCSPRVPKKRETALLALFFETTTSAKIELHSEQRGSLKLKASGLVPETPCLNRSGQLPNRR